MLCWKIQTTLQRLRYAKYDSFLSRHRLFSVLYFITPEAQWFTNCEQQQLVRKVAHVSRRLNIDEGSQS